MPASHTSTCNSFPQKKTVLRLRNSLTLMISTKKVRDTCDAVRFEALTRCTDKAFALPSLPFAHHIRRLELSPRASHDAIERVLTGAYVSLLDLVISTIRASPDHPLGTPSYNVVLTKRHLILVPRSKENAVLSNTGEELSVNALGFAGMLLVKCEEEMQAVIEEGPAKILAGVGCKSVHEEQVKGGPELDGDIDAN